MSNKTKAALIGCGMIADTHLTALLNAGANVVGVLTLIWIALPVLPPHAV